MRTTLVICLLLSLFGGLIEKAMNLTNVMFPDKKTKMREQVNKEGAGTAKFLEAQKKGAPMVENIRQDLSKPINEA